MLLTFGKNLTLLSCLLALVLAQFGCSRVAQKVAPEANKAAQEAEKQVIKHPEVQKVTQQGKQLIKNFRKKINKKRNKNISQQQAKTKSMEKKIDLLVLTTIITLIKDAGNTAVPVFAEIRQNKESKNKDEVIIPTFPTQIRQADGSSREIEKVFSANCRELNYSSIVERNGLNKYSSKELNSRDKKILVNSIIKKALPDCVNIINKRK